MEATASRTVSFHFDRARLVPAGRQHASRYHEARPFPHIVLDDFVPADIVDQCVAEFPTSEQEWDLYTDAGNSQKLAISDQSRMGPVTRHLISEFNGSAMISFLEELTGINGLVPDPHLVGGGLHQLGRGGFLNVHADFNRHPRLKLDRRLNVILYLNRDWREEYGGNLELWNSNMTRCVQRIVPEASRCVVFNTTDFSFHGNPQPVAAPNEMPRRSLAFYYYTNGRPQEEQSASHTTLYQTPGVSPRPDLRRSRLKDFARSLVPPIVGDVARRQRSRAR